MTPFGSNESRPPAESLFIQIADGKRVFTAYCVDGILALTAIGAIVFLLSQGESSHLIRGAHVVDSVLLWCASQLKSIGIACFTVFTGFLLYQCSGVAQAGYTPGRRLAGIVLVHKDGRELSRTRLMLRAVLSIFSWMFLGAGYFWPLLDKYHRNLHDLCTQTVLVQRRLSLS